MNAQNKLNIGFSSPKCSVGISAMYVMNSLASCGYTKSKANCRKIVLRRESFKNVVSGRNQTDDFHFTYSCYDSGVESLL